MAATASQNRAEHRRTYRDPFPAHGSGKCRWGTRAAILCLLVNPAYVVADTIQAVTANRSAVPGAAYQAEKENFVGQECLTGSIVHQGTQRSTFSFEQSLSEKQASSLMGLSAGGRARFGAAEASASARFVKNAASNRLSVSAIWVSDYLLPNRKLTGPTLTDIGNGVRPNDTRWAETCGDQYVDEIAFGGRLFFTIRVDFSSEEQKRAFEADFSISGPLYSASAKLEDASRKFSRDVKVTVTAVQFGGDVTKLTSLFDGSKEGQADFVQCTLGGFENCAKVIASALRYATDINSGFPSQLTESSKPGPAILEYHTAPYSAAGIYPQNYPHLDAANKAARSRLHDAFEKSLTLSVLADRLLSIRLSPSQRAKITAERDKIDDNVRAVLASSKVCYETPLQCVDSVSDINLVPIVESVFDLPPSTRGSYRIMTVDKGVWSRPESVSAMKDCKRTHADIMDDVPISACLPAISGPLEEFGHLATVSTVLSLEGTDLDTATFYFEDASLGTISLRSGDAAYPEKRGQNSAVIVIDSNRKNPNWIDFDRRAFIRTLMNGKYPDADGIFYVTIKDVFGRTERFDIEYCKWTSTEVQRPSGKVRSIAYWESRRRAFLSPEEDGITLVDPKRALLGERLMR